MGRRQRKSAHVRTLSFVSHFRSTPHLVVFCRHFTGHKGPVKTCAVSDDDSILSGSWDKTVRQWDITTGDQKSAFLQHSDMVNSCTWVAGGKALSVSKDGSGLVWQ